MSEANRVSIKSLAEVSYGVTPADSDVWQYMRYKSENLAGVPRTVISNEIRSDRQVSDLIVTGNDSKGDIAGELSYGSYDEWIAAALAGAWSTNVLKAGILKPSFSLEVGFEDWSPVQYLQFKGMRVGSMDLNFGFGEVATANFSFMGNAALQSTTSLRGAGDPPIAATTTDVMDAAAGVTAITLDGGAPGAAVKRVSMKIDNSLRPIEGIGSVSPSDIAYGRSMVTGTIEMYFDTIAMYNKLLAGTAAALSITVTKTSQSYTILLPKIKFSTGVPAVSGIDTDVMIPLEFTALYDSIEATQMKITRVP